MDLNHARLPIPPLRQVIGLLFIVKPGRKLKGRPFLIWNLEIWKLEFAVVITAKEGIRQNSPASKTEGLPEPENPKFQIPNFKFQI
jgi:hypothetical protein